MGQLRPHPSMLRRTGFCLHPKFFFSHTEVNSVDITLLMYSRCVHVYIRNAPLHLRVLICKAPLLSQYFLYISLP